VGLPDYSANSLNDAVKDFKVRPWRGTWTWLHCTSPPLCLTHFLSLPLPLSSSPPYYQERIDFYRQKYEFLSLKDDMSLSFIKMMDVGRYFIVHRIGGYLQMRISRSVST